jgi:hypothetical protein
MATLPRPARTAGAGGAEAASAAATPLPAPAPVSAAARGISSMDVPINSLPLSALTPQPGSMPQPSPFHQRVTRSIPGAGHGPVAVAAGPSVDLHPAAGFGGYHDAAHASRMALAAGMRPAMHGMMMPPQGE